MCDETRKPKYLVNVVENGIHVGKLAVYEDSCIVCKHCTDVFLDPWHGYAPYAFACSIDRECENYICSCFEFDDEDNNINIYKEELL